MLYIGIDPSYTKTGVTYIDSEKKEITFKAITPKGKNESYTFMIHRAMEVINRIVEDIDNNNIKVIIEEPLITSQMASSLGILSGVIITSLIENVKVKSIYTINPNAVSNTNRRLKIYTPKTKKKVSKIKALEYLEVFKRDGFTVNIINDKFNKDGSMKNREISPDEAESFIMMIILLDHLNVLKPSIWAELLSLNKGLNSDRTVSQLK